MGVSGGGVDVGVRGGGVLGGVCVKCGCVDIMCGWRYQEV